MSAAQRSCPPTATRHEGKGSYDEKVISIECEGRLQSQSALKPRARSFFLFVALPAWLGPGLLDWRCHRRTHIEEPANGGTTESLVHSAMFAEAGLPLLLAAAFEMNPFLVTLMTGAAASHEVTAMLDVRLALKSRRHVSQWEQHIHSFLEVMPFWIVPLMVLLNEPVTNQMVPDLAPLRVDKTRIWPSPPVGSRSQECFPTPKS